MPPAHLARPGRNLLTAAALAGLLFSALPARAQVEGLKGLSIGAGASVVHGRTDCVSSYPCDRRDAAFKLFGAYRVAESIELQALVLQTGRLQGGNTTLAGTDFGGDFKVQAFGLTGGYRWPLAGGWLLKANAGIAAVRTRFRYAAPYTGETSKTVAQPLVGLGVAYPLAPGWELSLDYDATRFKVHTQYGNLQMLGVSARYSF